MLVFFFCCCCCCCSGPQCLADKVASSRFKYLPNTCLPALTRLSLSDTQSDIMAVSDPVELSKQSYLAHKFYNYMVIQSPRVLQRSCKVLHIRQASSVNSSKLLWKLEPSTMHKLDTIQRWAATWVKQDYRRSAWVGTMQEQLHWPTLENWRKQACLTTFYF